MDTVMKLQLLYVKDCIVFLDSIISTEICTYFSVEDLEASHLCETDIGLGNLIYAGVLSI